MGFLGAPNGAVRLFVLCVSQGVAVPLGCPSCTRDFVGTQVSCKETSTSITGKYFTRNMRAGPKIQLQVR